jgi:hypothetical protein
MFKVVYNGCYGGFGLSKEAIKYLNVKYGIEVSVSGPWLKEDLPRHDKRLVDVIEVLGDKANGMCAKLLIAEIDSPMYRIDEYDGFESVETPDSYEWVVIS